MALFPVTRTLNRSIWVSNAAKQAQKRCKKGAKTVKKCKKQLKVGCKRFLKMDIAALPAELQNLVCIFAFGVGLKVVKSDLDILFEIKGWRLPDQFVENRVYNIDLGYYVRNPLDSYMPLATFGNIQCLFDTFVISNVIDRLDFRKRVVKQWGTRWQWTVYSNDWEFYGLFAAFYREMAKHVPSVLRPYWKDTMNLCGVHFKMI